MVEYSGEAAILIQAPAEAVYAYLADFPRHPEWAQNLSRVTPLAPGPIAVGAVYKTAEGPPPVAPGQRLLMMVHYLAGVLGGAKTYSEARITALEPPRRIAWQGSIPKGDGYFNLAEWEFVLEPRGPSTLVTQRFCWKPKEGAARRMVGAAGANGLKRSTAVGLARLKRRLEQSSG